MKKWFAIAAIFLSSYIVFLLANAPLVLVINNVNLPQNIEINKVTGTIWQGEIALLRINDNDIEQVKASVSFWSLFSLAPTIEVQFGDAMLAGPEGKFTLTVSSQQLTLTDVELFVSASDIARQLPLPIPIAAQGNIELYLPALVLATGANWSCSQAQGHISWLRAGVVALEQNIKLGSFKADLSCAQGNLLATLAANNNLGLSFDGTLALASKKVSGQGHLKPGAKFPSQLKATLSFLGRPDNQGRYQLKL